MALKHKAVFQVIKNNISCINKMNALKSSLDNSPLKRMWSQMAGPEGNIRSRESGHLSARHKTQRFKSDEILYGI